MSIFNAEPKQKDFPTARGLIMALIYEFSVELNQILEINLGSMINWDISLILFSNAFFVITYFSALTFVLL